MDQSYLPTALVDGDETGTCANNVLEVRKMILIELSITKLQCPSGSKGMPELFPSQDPF
jgi:hypothetical protein